MIKPIATIVAKTEKQARSVFVDDVYTRGDLGRRQDRSLPVENGHQNAKLRCCLYCYKAKTSLPLTMGAFPEDIGHFL